jgi:hypothetical protein
MSAGATPPSSLIRTHASAQKTPVDFGFPCSSGLCRLSSLPAASWPFPTLSLRNLSLRASPPIPAALVMHLLVSSHKTSAFPETVTGRRFAETQTLGNFSRGYISELQLFVYLQARKFARPPYCSHLKTTALGSRGFYFPTYLSLLPP